MTKTRDLSAKRKELMLWLAKEREKRVEPEIKTDLHFKEANSIIMGVPARKVAPASQKDKRQ